MGTPRAAPSVKLICGLLSGDPDLLRRARQWLMRMLGPIDLESEVWPFPHTDYYREEMGPDLLRQFLSFERLIRPEALAEIKLETNRVEADMAQDCAALEVARPVNLDPGYIDLGKLVLATTKDRSHRLYIKGGIFAEVTLQWTSGAWQGWPWTYPDYLQPAYHEFFSRVRKRLAEQRRAALPDAEPLE